MVLLLFVQWEFLLSSYLKVKSCLFRMVHGTTFFLSAFQKSFLQKTPNILLDTFWMKTLFSLQTTFRTYLLLLSLSVKFSFPLRICLKQCDHFANLGQCQLISDCYQSFFFSSSIFSRIKSYYSKTLVLILLLVFVKNKRGTTSSTVTVFLDTL